MGASVLNIIVYGFLLVTFGPVPGAPDSVGGEKTSERKNKTEGAGVFLKFPQKQEDTMAVVNMKELLEAGVHFGHQTRRWNPKMKPYIFGSRNGIHIIDLQKTVHLFGTAYDFVARTVADGYSVLFVGTKKQAHDSIIEESERCGMFSLCPP